MTKLSYCLGVVLYNPTEQDIKYLNGCTQENLFREILVFDNSPISQAQYLSKNIKYFFTGKNEGLSIPYNKMISYAIKNHFDYLCLLDQDSKFAVQGLRQMVSYINLHASQFNDVAIIAPRICLPSSKYQFQKGDRLTSATFAINSGSFLHLACLDKYNLRYDESIFLDGVDIDFCWSVRERKCLIQIYENVVFQQNLGYQIEGRKRFSAHASLRYYYFTHNRRYIWRKHAGQFKGPLIAFLRNVKTLFAVLRKEEHKWSKIKEAVRGMIY